MTRLHLVLLSKPFAPRRFELNQTFLLRHPTRVSDKGPVKKTDRTTRFGHYFVCLELVWAIWLVALTLPAINKTHQDSRPPEIRLNAQ